MYGVRSTVVKILGTCDRTQEVLAAEGEEGPPAVVTRIRGCLPSLAKYRFYVCGPKSAKRCDGSRS